MKKIYTKTQTGLTVGECPVCNGTGKMLCPTDEIRKYGVKYGWYGYDVKSDTVNCTNCGAQYMYGTPNGIVRLNKNGMPCVHSYSRDSYSFYVCKHCGDKFHYDSGD